METNTAESYIETVPDVHDTPVEKEFEILLWNEAAYRLRCAIDIIPWTRENYPELCRADGTFQCSGCSGDMVPESTLATCPDAIPSSFNCKGSCGEKSRNKESFNIKADMEHTPLSVAMHSLAAEYLNAAISDGEGQESVKRQGSLIQAAFFYADKGWQVHDIFEMNRKNQCSCGNPKCESQGKHPRRDRWQERATTDKKKILAMWSGRNCHSNIGIRTGKESNLCVVDVDGEAGRENFDELKQRVDIPDTFRVITGSGGFHYYFTKPADMEYFTGGTDVFADKIDFRCDGNYVLAPPSNHESGNQYEWDPDCISSGVQIAELPLGLLEIARQQKASGSGKIEGNGKSKPKGDAVSPTGKKRFEIPENAPDGTRNETLFRLIRSYKGKGFSEKETHFNAFNFNRDRCIPPKTDDEFEKIFTHAWSYQNSAKSKFYHEDRIVREPDKILFFSEKETVDLFAPHACATGLVGGYANATGTEKLPGSMQGDERKIFIFLESQDPADVAGSQKLASGLAENNKFLKIVDLAPFFDGKSLKSLFEKKGFDHVKQVLTDAAEKSEWYAPPILQTSQGRVIEISNYVDLLQKEIPEQDWIIQEFVRESNLVILAGPPKVGKSLITLGWCLEVASGGYAFDRFKCAQGKTLNVALEDPERRLQTRLRKISRGKPMPPGGLFTRDWPLLPEGTTMLERWLDANEGVKLVVLDTLQKLKPAKDRHGTEYELDYRTMGGLQKIAIERSLSIVVVHHLNKGKNNEGGDLYARVLGSTALTGAADSILILERDRLSTEGTIFVSGRDIEEKKHSVAFDVESLTWSYLGEASDVKRSSEANEVRDILRASEGKPMSVAQIAEKTNPRVRSDTIRKRLDRMAKRGEVLKAAGMFGKYVLPPDDLHYGGSPEYGGRF
ncbi:bifunctional DNA primase/polymerase [Desulfomonile tiedjei]|uniref:Bifunctional DNA primase/polymerase famiily protein n=1 Tax=Desulfomonile tiedjei (strain ATCC 49306 / DSM 6799 / DCB-1) TaxID=706587 RepID=I4CE30_DESTA|nr:bifunctional DNA primase/polymerase [Desulfomonile tiedjei]AFM27821.1 bifunctional DNA primase/polymerase famiily protein [Desulfomonile tiedjei DSM 6799]